MGRPPVMDGYIRVLQIGGRSGETFQSTNQQRDAIEAWAKTNGVRSAAWHEDVRRHDGPPRHERCPPPNQ